MNFLARISCRRKLLFISGLLVASTTLACLAQILPLTKTQIISFWALALVGGVVSLAGIVLTERGLMHQVNELATHARAIADGDLTGTSSLSCTGDEVAELGCAIDRMQQKLHSLVAGIMETAATVHRDARELGVVGSQAWTRTSEQGAQTHQAASAMQEMSISIAEVSGHAQTAADQAREAATVAREGGVIVEEMLAGMNTISDSVSQTATTVERLGKESEQIIRIVNVIEEIAEKTNLLALNAAIEAARAGEQGRGFAVVAGEVRRLAESTRAATSEIAQMIDGIRKNTQDAVRAMSSGTERVSHGMEITARAGESLKRIIAATDQVESMIAQIATASTEQSVAAQEFSQNLEVINRLSEEGNAASPVTKGLVESVATGAARLEESIGNFRIAEERPGDRSDHRPSRPAATAQPATSFGD
jgi:methyl-accepting chemotaxis protein